MIAFFAVKIVELIKVAWIDETRRRRGFLIKKEEKLSSRSKQKQRKIQPAHTSGSPLLPAK